jgi:hypothetical protein
MPGTATGGAAGPWRPSLFADSLRILSGRWDYFEKVSELSQFYDIFSVISAILQIIIHESSFCNRFVH